MGVDVWVGVAVTVGVGVVVNDGVDVTDGVKVIVGVGVRNGGKSSDSIVKNGFCALIKVSLTTQNTLVSPIFI